MITFYDCYLLSPKNLIEGLQILVRQSLSTHLPQLELSISWPIKVESNLIHGVIFGLLVLFSQPIRIQSAANLIYSRCRSKKVIAHSDSYYTSCSNINLFSTKLLQVGYFFASDEVIFVYANIEDKLTYLITVRLKFFNCLP